MYYSIELHQSSLETQVLNTSESHEEITKFWEEAKAYDDYAWMDEELTLRESPLHWDDDNYDSKMIDCYLIPKSQQNF